MTGEMKFYLLAELSGWNLSSISYSYQEYLKNNYAYQILENNINEVKKHISKNAQAIVDAYNEITFKVNTVKDCFLLENAINYVALHSFEEYYINPLTINPNYNGRLTTIGELIFDFKGEERPLNEIIKDENYSDEDKKETVYLQLEKYLDDADDLVYASIENVKNQASYKNGSSIIKFILEYLVILSLNISYLFMMIIPFKKYQFFYLNFENNSVMAYTLLFYTISLLAYDLVFVLFHSYRAKILEPYNFAKRFLNKYSSKVFDDLISTKDKLYNYISGAINEKLELQNDIKDFSKLSSSYIDFEAVLSSSSLKNKKTYKVFKAINLSFMSIASIVGLISLIVYILGIIFNAQL